MFDFDFKGLSRTELLGRSAKAIGAGASNLGVGDAAAPSAADAARTAATGLLAALDQEVAEFAGFPEIVPLEARHFEAHGMKPPARFEDLSRQHRFYWLRIPMTLRPLQDRPFVKLQCAVEFNPGVAAAHLRPVAQMILPDRKFQQMLAANTSLTLGIGEDFEFEAKGQADVGTADTLSANGKASVDAKAAASAGMTVGPFQYSLKKAVVNHSGTGTEKVFWTLDGAEFFEEQEPVLVVVLRVPNEVTELHVAAALQAFHDIHWLVSSVGNFFTLLGDRMAGFFKKGAPATHTQVWNLTPRL
ncbi:hypothetical protein [Ideonella sp. A 288]|uniref:hypothetical protein n=1 Tax=Ideonella sp. A 288 TaxID=1962181 RepID=UPI001303DDF0|nr:hypothetical protein [Ideonella sp. A 288]